MRVLLEDKNQTVEIPDGLSPEAMETELRKFYTPEELYGSTTFQEREGYRVRKGRAVVDDGKNWYEAVIGNVSDDVARSKSDELTSEFTKENDEKYQAHNWPERFAGATTELAPYMMDSAIQGTLYGEGMGAAAAGAALIGGQAGPQVLIPEEIVTVPTAYIAGKSVGQAWGSWMNAAKVETGQLYKSMVTDGIDSKTAKSFAVPAGYLIGAIELLQVERLIPGFGREGIASLVKSAIKKQGPKTAQTFMKFSGRLGANLTKTTAIETAQEETQEILGIAAEVGAAVYEDMASEEGYLGPDAEEVKKRLQDTLTQSLLGFPLLGLPGSVHNTVSLHGKERFAERVLTKKAQKSLNLELTGLIEQASEAGSFQEFQESLGEQIDDKFANKLGFDNRPLLEEALWNQSRNLQGEHIYEENFRQQEESGFSLEPLREAYKSSAEAISRIAEPISTRLNQINPKLKDRMRRYEFDLRQRVLRDERLAKPFLEKHKKLSDKDKSYLDLALKNNDKQMIDEIVDRNNMRNEYSNVRYVLDQLFERARKTGVDIGYITEYYPRQIKDPKGMLKFFKQQEQWPEMQKVINEKEEKLGRKLTDLEKAQLLNTMLTGIRGKNRTPGNIKKREISVVTPDINEFYQDAPQSLLNYIYSVNDYVETRRFFGKSAKSAELNEEAIKASIGAFVLELLETGEVTGAQAQEVSDALLARFSTKGTGKNVSLIKNISYLETMGSVTSAITQIGDIAFSLYKNGFYKTGKAFSKSLLGKPEITKEDIGIEKIAEEFSDKSTSAKAVDKVFKIIGLEWMDRLGKQTQINAAFYKFKALAEKKDKKFIEKMKSVFGKYTEQVVNDLKEGVASDNVKFLLFSELADVQPIALSEMPEGYLRGGNARILYMLKTYTIKQIDVFRNEVFLQMRKDPAKALSNFVRLSAMLILANATADVIKDLILGRPLESDDDEENYIWEKITDNILRLSGLTKYSLYKFKKEGVAEGISSIVLPPILNFITRGAKDIDKSMKDDGEFEPHQAEIIQSVPLLGKLYYWWFGGGRKKIEEEQ